MTTKMCQELGEVLLDYENINFINSENMDVIARLYSGFNEMLNAAKYVKDEMRKIVKNKTNGQMSHVIKIKGRCPQAFNIDRELLMKLIDISMQDFCYFEIYKGGEQLITYDYFDCDLTTDGKVVLNFNKILPE